MNRKMSVTMLGVAALLASAASASAAINLNFTRTALSDGLFAYDFFIENTTPGAGGSYAIDMGFLALGSATINQLNTPILGTPIVNLTGAEQANLLGGGVTTFTTQDTYVYDRAPGSAAGSPGFATANPGSNWFGSDGVDTNGGGSGFFTGQTSDMTPGLGANKSWAIAYGYGTPTTATNIPVAHIVASGNVRWNGVVAYQAVANPVAGSTEVATDFVNLVTGSNAGVVVPGDGVSYTPTVVQTYATPTETGSVDFSFAGTNTGAVLVGLDLNLGSGTLDEALGSLQGGLAVYGGANPFGAEYDVVLISTSSGAGPYTFSFDLGGGATVNAIAVVPEPASMGLLALAALPALSRRRRA